MRRRKIDSHAPGVHGRRGPENLRRATHNGASSAYWTVPAAEEVFLAAAVVNPYTGKVSFFVQRGHAFGLGASVLNYFEGSTFMCIVAVEFMAAPIMAFIGSFSDIHDD